MAKKYEYGSTRIYTKAIAISEENLNWIKKNKGKKSAAGFLDNLINHYKK